MNNCKIIAEKMKQICMIHGNYGVFVTLKFFSITMKFELIVLRARGVHFDLRQNSATKTMVLLTRSGAFVGTNVHTISSHNVSFCGPTPQKSVLTIEPLR